ncbi:MAG: CRISPR-associated protein Cas4 [Thermofilaceae archaeon]
MWSWSDVITPWDVKQYVYCPAIPWIARNFGVREPETLSMRLGREERQRRLSTLEALGLEPPIRLDVEMYSLKLLMAGTADAVAGSRRLTVIEVKAFKRKTLAHFRAQLMAYALLSEECLGPTVKAVLLAAGRALAFDVDGEALREARRLAARVREVIEGERCPSVERGARCLSCWYRRFCPIW